MTEKVHVRFGLAFVQLINVVSTLYINFVVIIIIIIYEMSSVSLSLSLSLKY